MSKPLSTLTLSAAPTLLCLLMILFATYVTFEVCRRVRRCGTAPRSAWLMLAALGLSCGIWSAQILGLGEVLTPYAAGFRPDWVVAAVLVTLALTLLALHWAYAAAPRWPQVLASAFVLGLATLAAQVLLVLSIGLKFAIDWHAGRLLWAWAVGAGGFALALFTHRTVRDDAPLQLQPRQLAAAAIAGLAVLACQSLTNSAAALSAILVVNDATSISADTMTRVSALGGSVLLVLTLLACAVESHLRRSPDTARAERQDYSFRDGLTQLPSRSTFNGTLAQALQQADSRETCAVLLHVALDGFKHVNDNFGHEAGDAVLKCIAKRLRALAQPHRLARLGGDEFLMLLDGEDAVQQSKRLAASVLHAIAQPCAVGARECSLTCSIGLAVYPQHGAMSTLITHASIATRASKSAGGATYSFFDTRMVNEIRDQAELLRDLRLALSRGQLELYYQPKIHAPSGQIAAAEALLRWHHPQRGMISPAVFIPIAERNGLINALGAWVIDDACKQARQWRDQGLRMRVAINLSAQQLRQHDLPGHITAALAKHQINPDLLTCEITESVAMEDTEATLRFFTELAAVGVHISIDDFGSGYSSLAYLRKLPAGELKIDRSFVLDLETSEEARKIAAAVVQLAQALNLKVVAEGVETNAQFQILRQMGCDELQGFLFAKPMSAKALALWAIADEGPRSIQFSESLFQGTREMAL